MTRAGTTTQSPLRPITLWPTARPRRGLRRRAGLQTGCQATQLGHPFLRERPFRWRDRADDEATAHQIDRADRRDLGGVRCLSQRVDEPGISDPRETSRDTERVQVVPVGWCRLAGVAGERVRLVEEDLCDDDAERR
jgi:hypothetical protein